MSNDDSYWENRYKDEGKRICHRLGATWEQNNTLEQAILEWAKDKINTPVERAQLELTQAEFRLTTLGDLQALLDAVEKLKKEKWFQDENKPLFF